MKKLLLFIVIISFVHASSYSAEGDTIHVQSHQETHWDWNGNWYDTTSFPASGEYRRILMYYTLGCPSQGCADYDYTTKIEVEDPIDDSTSRWVELVRIMTPFSGDKGSQWKHTWVIDVTDYASILNGERSVRAHYGGWADGYIVSIDFDFIEGTPPRNVLDINTVYDGTFRYGFANDPIEDHLVPKDIDIHPDLKSAKFRMLASGHSFGGNENCAEFCKKWYKLYAGNSLVEQQTVWRDDCGSNPIEDQPGTWIYNRSGWCPGDITTPYDHEVGGYLIPGSTTSLNVDWQNYNYQGGAGFDPQYIIEASLFQYDDWNFENDLAISDVISPSMNDRASELNPICNNPQIVVTNSGSEYVTSAKFRFWVEGSPDVINYKWT
ncbi:MAG: peptide-N-glycosidase F-related protein, partial [Salibacteraceae bacterium]